MKMKNSSVAFAVAVLVSAAMAAPAMASSYQFRLFAKDVKSASPIVASPSYVGDGVSKIGACASGMTGCAIWNSADKGPGVSMLAGNLGIRGTGSSWGGIRATSNKSSGKWYWETISTPYSGIANSAASMAGVNLPGIYTYRPDGYYYANGVYPAGGMQFSQSNWDMWLGFALDMDNKTLTVVGPAGSFTISGLTASSYSPYFAVNASQPAANFGQLDFQYAVPAGYHAGIW